MTNPATAAVDRFTAPSARPILALAGGIVCIGFSAIFVRFAHTTGDVVTVFRSGIAVLILGIPLLIRWRQGRVRLSWGALPFVVAAGAAFAVDNTVWAFAVNLTTAANATLLSNTAPLWVGLASWVLFRERLGVRYWLGLLTALAGIVIIIGLDALRGLGTNPGNLLGLVSGFSYATYQLVTERGRKQVDALTWTVLFSLTGFVLMGGVAATFHHSLINLPREAYLALIALGVISHAGGWLLINYAFGHLRASALSVTLLLQPVLTAIFALLILGEAPQSWHVIGGLVTLAGIYIVHSRRAEQHPAPVLPPPV